MDDVYSSRRLQQQHTGMKPWVQHDDSASDAVQDQTQSGAAVGTSAAVQVTPKQLPAAMASDKSNSSSTQDQGPPLADKLMQHTAEERQLGPQQKKQRYMDLQKPLDKSGSQLELVEPKVLQQHYHHQQQQQPAANRGGLPPSPQQQQQQLQSSQQAAPPSPEARRSTFAGPATAGGGSGQQAAAGHNAGARISNERSLSGALLSPAVEGGLLGLPDLSSPTPFAPKYYISNDGTIAASNQQRKRLSVAIPAEGASAAATAGSFGHQSPVGNMMASLLAETAVTRAPSMINTPWGNPPTAIAGLFSPASVGALDAAANTLVSPRAQQGAAVVSGRLGSIDSGAQELLGPATGPQVAGSRLAGRKRPLDAALLDPRCAEVCNAAQAAAVAAMGSPSSGISDHAALEQWQQTIEAAEQQWGPSHPAVARAWLELARVWQASDKESDKAKHATKKAFDICQILLKQTAMESQAQESFQYLLDKFNRKSTAAKQAQQAAASAAKEAAVTALEPAAATVAAPGFMPYGSMGYGHPAMQQHFDQQYPAVAFLPGICMQPDAGSFYAHIGVQQQGIPQGFAAPAYAGQPSVVLQQHAVENELAAPVAAGSDKVAAVYQGSPAPGNVLPMSSDPLAAGLGASAAPAGLAAANGGGVDAVSGSSPAGAAAYAQPNGVLRDLQQETPMSGAVAAVQPLPLGQQ